MRALHGLHEPVGAAAENGGAFDERLAATALLHAAVRARVPADALATQRTAHAVATALPWARLGGVVSVETWSPPQHAHMVLP